MKAHASRPMGKFLGRARQKKPGLALDLIRGGLHQAGWSAKCRGKYPVVGIAAGKLHIYIGHAVSHATGDFRVRPAKPSPACRFPHG